MSSLDVVGRIASQIGAFPVKAAFNVVNSHFLLNSLLIGKSKQWDISYNSKKKFFEPFLC